MTKGYLIKIVVSLIMMLTAVTAQENVDAIEKARQAKEAADKAAAEAAAATSAAIEAAAAKAAKEAREEAKRKKEEEEARKIAEAKAAEEAELDAAAAAAAEEAKRKMAAELGLEVDDPEVEEAVAEATVSEGAGDAEEAEEVVAKEASGWGFGVTGSVGMINGEYILNTPVGGSLTITTPYGLKLGALNLEVSLAFGSYSGETPNSPEYTPTFFGVGGNLTLADFLFYEGHVGIVGAGPGGRGFGGVTLERLLKRSMNLPFNLLVGAEGFLSTQLEDGRDEASYWGGLGVRLDMDF